MATKPTGATKVGGMYYDIGADLTKLNTGLKEAEKNAQKTGKSLEASLTKAGQKMASVGKGLTVGLTVPIIGVGTAITKMAMDAEESENLFVVSMGNMEKAGREWSENLREELGLNEYETRKMLSTFNVMLDSMGLGEKAAYDMSTGLSELAYDMASFYNLDPQEAFQKLQAGITGEIEPLKRLGIVVNETTIKAVAYEHGIASLGEELTEQEKIQARYIAIMEQTEKAQGDLARTIDSPTNQLRIMRDELKQAGVEFGQVLIPALQEGIKVIRGITGWLADMDEEQKKNVVRWAAIAAGIGPVLLGLGKILIVVPKIIQGFKLLQPVLLAAKSNLLALVANPVVLGLAAVAAAITTIIVSAKKGREAVAEALSSADERQAARTQQMVDDAKAAAREEYDIKIAALEEQQAADDKYYEASAQRWKEYQEEKIEIQKEALQDQLDDLEKSHDDAIDAIRREYGVVADNYKSKTDLANEYYDNEIARANEAYNEKVALINKELAEQLKLVDQEAYRQMEELQNQISSLDRLTEEEERQERLRSEQEKKARLQRAIDEAKDDQERIDAQADFDEYIAELARERELELREARKTSLQNQIEDIREAAAEEKTELEQAAADKIAIEEENLQTELGLIEDRRVAAIQAIQDERKEKEEAENAKYEATKQSITDQLKAIDEGKGAYFRALQREILEKRKAEDDKYLATKESVDKQIEELERLASEAERIATETATAAATTSEAAQKRQLIDQYAALNTQYQEAIAAMGDDNLLGRTWKTLTGGYRAELAPIEREMEKIAGTLHDMGVPGFQTGGVSPPGDLFRANEKEPEIIIPESRFNEVIQRATRAAQSAVGAFGGEVVYRHTGTIEVRGVNTRGELIDIIDVTVDKKIREQSRVYGD